MTSDRPRPRSRRRLTADEHALWKTVTRSVAPLRKGKRTEVDGTEAVSAPAAPAKTKSKPLVTHPAKPAARSAKPAPPALAPLARRLKQRVARGSEPIDARLDLHGLTQEQAHNALRRFLRNAQADGAKLVLVITGKGARASGFEGSERGVLKRLVPQWLQLPDMRAYVVGFEAAHVTHGGEGALYVRVRRARLLKE
jgi:DNA-nicking Smr family endonuclease